MTIIRKIIIAAPAATAIFCTAVQPVQAGCLNDSFSSFASLKSKALRLRTER